MELVINALPSYTSTSKALFGNTILHLRCFTQAYVKHPSYKTVLPRAAFEIIV
jgi:hypothetical protein